MILKIVDKLIKFELDPIVIAERILAFESVVLSMVNQAAVGTKFQAEISLRHILAFDRHRQRSPACSFEFPLVVRRATARQQQNQ